MKRTNLLAALVAASALVAALVAGSAGAAAATTPSPAAPTGLTATPGNTTVALSWTAPTGVSVLGYNVFEATVSGAENYSTPGNGNILVTGTTAVVRGLTNGTTYYFTVTAVTTTGSSTNTPEVWAIPGGTAPGAPTSVSAIAGDASATVSWSPPTNQGGSMITGYKVTATDSTQSSKGGQSCTWITGPLSCVVSGLTNGDSYTFTVTATNTVGTGAASSASNAVVPNAAPPKKTATKVTLALSGGSIIFGREWTEHVSASVTHAGTGASMSGRVFVMAQPCRIGNDRLIGVCPLWALQPRMEFVCVMQVGSSGSGSCSVAARQLGVGTFRLFAFYTGDANYRASVSSSKVLNVFRNPHLH